MFGPAKAPEIKETLLGPREGNTHAIEEEDYRGRHLAHRFCGWLIGQKVAAVNRVVKVFPGRVAFALSVDGAIDATLSANRVRAFHRNNGEKIHAMACFGNSH